MTTITRLMAKAGLAALIALTGISASAPIAAAAGPEFVQYRERNWRPHHPPRYERPRHMRPVGCSPRLAERRAEAMGLRRTRVVDISRRSVTVVGVDRRGRDRVVFANVRGCPLIRR